MFAAPPRRSADVFAVLPTALQFPVAEGGRPRRLNRPNMHSFLEGPSFDRHGNLYVVDIAQGCIFRVTPEGEFQLVAKYQGEPNGLKIHRDGTIYIADFLNGILQLKPGDREPVSLCRGPAEGERFNGVNDLFFASNGDLYFTDQGPADMLSWTGRVFRLRAAGGPPELLLSGIPSPNGLVLTPDEKFLIVAVTRANAVWRAPLHADGTVGRVGVFLQLSGGGSGPDGLAIDTQGNLAVAHPLMGAVWLFSARGEPLLRIDSAAGTYTTNVAYGGPDSCDLYITESETGSILRCTGLPAPGQPMYSHAS